MKTMKEAVEGQAQAKKNMREADATFLAASAAVEWEERCKEIIARYGRSSWELLGSQLLVNGGYSVAVDRVFHYGPNNGPSDLSGYYSLNGVVGGTVITVL